MERQSRRENLSEEWARQRLLQRPGAVPVPTPAERLDAGAYESLRTKPYDPKAIILFPAILIYKNYAIEKKETVTAPHTAASPRPSELCNVGYFSKMFRVSSDVNDCFACC
jgi:hypothetical protein